MLQEFPVEAVLHCGDIGTTEIVSVFKPWPTHYVFGNVDYDVQSLRAAIRKAGHTCHERFGSLELAGTKIALLHSDDEAAFRAAATSGEYQLVCYGHTHVAKQQIIGQTLVLNPGALYRATPHTLALVELPGLTVQIVSV